MTTMMMEIADIPFQIVDIEKTDYGYKLKVVVNQVFNKHTGDREKKFGYFETTAKGVIVKTPNGYHSQFHGIRLVDISEYMRQKEV